jgi:hypothetical protein
MKSLNLIYEKLGKIPIYVFTNDQAYAKSLLGSEKLFNYLDTENFRASEVMKLISFAKGKIISNSTLSYWSAIISAEQLTIAPQNWYKNTEINKDFYPKSWMIVK